MQQQQKCSKLLYHKHKFNTLRASSIVSFKSSVIVPCSYWFLVYRWLNDYSNSTVWWPCSFMETLTIRQQIRYLFYYRKQITTQLGRAHAHNLCHKIRWSTAWLASYRKIETESEQKIRIRIETIGKWARATWHSTLIEIYLIFNNINNNNKILRRTNRKFIPCTPYRNADRSNSTRWFCCILVSGNNHQCNFYTWICECHTIGRFVSLKWPDSLKSSNSMRKIAS